MATMATIGVAIILFGVTMPTCSGGTVLITSSSATRSEETMLMVCPGDAVYVECTVTSSFGLIWNIPGVMEQPYTALASDDANFVDPINFINILVTKITPVGSFSNSTMSSLLWFDIDDIPKNIDRLDISCTNYDNSQRDTVMVMQPGNPEMPKIIEAVGIMFENTAYLSVEWQLMQSDVVPIELHVDWMVNTGTSQTVTSNVLVFTNEGGLSLRNATQTISNGLITSTYQVCLRTVNLCNDTSETEPEQISLTNTEEMPTNTAVVPTNDCTGSTKAPVFSNGGAKLVPGLLSTTAYVLLVLQLFTM